MKMINTLKNKTLKTFIKLKLKAFLNKTFKWHGKHDDKIDKYADKTIDGIGVDNIMKAKKALKKGKKKP